MGWVVATLRENPELAVFLTLAIGFVIGRVRIGSFSLGNVVGTLLAGVLVGQLDIRIDPVVKVVFFDLFLFATGYKVGPQFFRGIRQNALSQALLTVVLCVASLVTTVAFSRLMGYDCGTAAGLMAGAFTESTVIGTAGNTIAGLDLPEAEKTRLLNNIPVAYAVTYLVGTTFVVWFLSSLAPRLLGVDLRAESLALAAASEKSAEGDADASIRPAYREWEVRAYRIQAGTASMSVAQLEESFAPERVFVARMRRGAETVDAVPGTLVQGGDFVAVTARRHVLLGQRSPLGDEIEDRELLDYPLTTLDLVITRRDAAERTLDHVAAEHGRGVVLQKLLRAGQEIPFDPATILNRGDLLRVAGSQADVERAGRALGYVERPSSQTDVVFLGLGIFMGGLFGALSVTVGEIPLSLTASGGALIMGLVFGWLRSVRPTFGRIPEPALWVFDTVGLAVFIGLVGIGAGPSFVAGLRTTGPSLLLVGFVVALTPHMAAVLFGRYVLEMNPVILLGACAGAGTATAALRAVQDAADSKLPVLGYTVPYAIGNILLTAWGPVIVVLTR
jgi:putative transport protein